MAYIFWVTRMKWEAGVSCNIGTLHRLFGTYSVNGRITKLRRVVGTALSLV